MKVPKTKLQYAVLIISLLVLLVGGSIAFLILRKSENDFFEAATENQRKSNLILKPSVQEN